METTLDKRVQNLEKFKNRVNELKNGVIPDKLIDNNIDWEQVKNTKYFNINEYYLFSDLMKYEDFLKMKSYSRNRNKKRNRCFDKENQIIDYAIENNLKVVFGTCTLNNDALSMNYDSLRKKLSRWLKKHFKMILKNNDYCPSSDRLHFHFIACLKENEELEPIGRKSKKGRPLFVLKNKDYKMGFEPVLEPIPNLTSKQLSNYLVKLNNHSNKKTTKLERLSLTKNL